MSETGPTPGEGKTSPDTSPALPDVAAGLGDAFRLLQAPSPSADEPSPPARRIRTGRETVEEDLLKLVLTIVELLRQLIERQALRRVDAGDLTDDQEEELGATLMALHDALSDLCAEHGYTLDDLNLDLGPLGPLLPREG
ncbi:gas vesicle protein K [Streptomyces sp. NPDC004284]|uniref:gas vesicle protein K n=1 Tax=Streptomyces sp. NPDC004284 TaxID=3364695 RepID=UPI0036B68714